MNGKPASISTDEQTYTIRTNRTESLEGLLRFYQFDFAVSPADEEPRHTLGCAMVKYPNCTHCDCGSSIDESTRASSGARSDQSHTRAQGILDTASGSVCVSAADPSGTPQDIGRASGSEVRHAAAEKPTPGSGAPAPGAADRCKCGHSDESHFIGSTEIKGPCIACSCMEWRRHE